MDYEEDVPVSDAIMARAKTLMHRVLDGVTRFDDFTMPTVTPDCNGHLHLLWRRDGSRHRLLIIAAGNDAEEVASIDAPAEGVPTRHVCSMEEAAQRVLRFLGELG